MKPAASTPSGSPAKCDDLPFAVRWYRTLLQRQADALLDINARTPTPTDVERAWQLMTPDERVLARSLPQVASSALPEGIA